MNEKYNDSFDAVESTDEDQYGTSENYRGVSHVMMCGIPKQTSGHVYGSVLHAKARTEGI